MANKQKIVLMLEGDATGAVKATQVTGKGLDDVEKKGKRVSSQFADIAKKGAQWATIAGGAAAAGAALMVKEQLSLIDNTAKVSDKLGIATERLTAMRVQAELTGVGANTLDMGLQRMVRRVAEAAEGTGEAQSALRELNIDAKALAVLSPDKQFAAIADAMEQVDGQSNKVRLAFKIFDSEGVGLVNTMKGGSAAAMEAAEFTEQWGLAINRVDASKIEQANDAMTMVSQASQGFWKQLTVNVSPAITGISKEILGMGKGFGTAQQLADKAFKGMVAGGALVADMGRVLQIIWKGAAKIVAEWFAVAWESVAGIDKALTWLLNKLPESLGGGSFKESDFLQGVAGSLRASADKLGGDLKDLLEKPLAQSTWPEKVKKWEAAATQAGERAAAAANVSGAAYDAATVKAKGLSDEEKKRIDTAQALLEGTQYKTELLERELAAIMDGEAALGAFNREKEIENALRGTAAQNLLPAELAKYTELVGKQYDLKAAIAAVIEAQKAQKEAQEASAKAVESYLDQDYSGPIEAFNEMSRAIVGTVDSLNLLVEEQEAYAAARAGAAGDVAKLAQVEEKHQKAQIGLYADMAAASKQFFDEGSKGYKALQAAEQAFRAYEILMAGKALVAKLLTIDTSVAATVASVGPTVAAEGAKATAAGTASAASSMVGIPFPANLAALAATVAALAGLGVLLGGSSGGGAGRGPTSNYDGSQGVTGSRTVLGDVDAVSESIANSLATIEELSADQAGYASGMLASLRNIERGLVGIAAEFGKLGKGDRIELDGQTVAQALSGDMLASLSSSTTRKLESILNAPAVGGPLRFAKSIARDKLPGALAEDADLLASINVLADIQRTVDGIVDSALAGFDVLGMSSAELRDQIVALELPELKISGSNDPDELAEKINGFFSSVGDSIVAVIAPSLTEFQRSGEGLLETLGRVASQTLTLRDVIDSLEAPLGTNADNLVAVADGVALAAGGLDEFGDAVGSFLDLVLTDSEQFQRDQRQVSALFGALGESVPQSTDALRDFVRGLDLSTEAGQRAFASVTGASELLQDFFDRLQAYADDAYEFDTALELADGLDPLRQALAGIGLTISQVEVAAQGGISGLQGLFGSLTNADKSALLPFLDSMLELIPAAQEAAEAIDNTAAALSERQGLEERLLRLQGDTLALRARERAELFESNRALFDQIAALEDQQAAAEATAKAQEEAARIADAIANERLGLERQLLQLQGDTATLRAIERSALDESNRALYDQVRALEDQAAAAQAAAAGQDALRAAYQRESSELQSTIAQFANLEQTLQDFANSLNPGAFGGFSAGQLRSQFADLSRRAQLGDVDAAGSLPEIGRALIQAVSGEAGSALEVSQVIAQVQRSSLSAAEVAGRQKSIAEQQLEELTNQVSALVDINDSVLSVRDAIQQLSLLSVPGFASGGVHRGGLRVVGERGPELEFTGPSLIMNNANSRKLLDNDELVQEVRALRSEMHRGLYHVAKNTGRTQRVLDDWDRIGLPEERVL